jgi:ferrous iron transport protein A
MKEITNLARMAPGETGRITGLTSGPGLVRRLEEIGLRVGQRVSKISGMPLRGPVVVQVGGTRVALGHGMAKKVMVETG